VWLTERCRQIVRTLPGWAAVQSAVGWLVDRYVDLQSIKHAPDREQRARALEAWYRTERRGDADVSWWEWAAATGSTLGLFALVSEAMTERPDADRVAALMDTYFPWMGGLHILLDYFIDQEEDRSGGDFNFVTCYANVEATVNGIARLHREACARADRLADAGFHRYIARGLLGFYLADRKVSGPLVDPARRLLATGGGISRGLWALARVGRAP
jgi:tetraprenyl-beta-curcumene synthase